MAKVSFNQAEGLLCAYLSGEIDHHSAQELRERIDARLLNQLPGHHIQQAGIDPLPQILGTVVIDLTRQIVTQQPVCIIECDLCHGLFSFASLICPAGA